MEEGLLVVFDYEEKYTERLTDYLNRRTNFGMEVRGFTRQDALTDFCNEHKTELLLTVDDTVADGVRPGQISHIILLSEGQWVKDSCAYPVIYKFQSIEQVMKEVLAYVSEQSEEMNYPGLAPKENTTQIYVVFAPEGGRVRTVYGIALAGSLAEHHETLYLNFDAFPGALWQKDGTAGLSEMIYYLKQQRGNLMAKLLSMVNHSGNLEYLAPVSHFRDLEEMGEEEYRFLFHTLREHSEYEAIVVEIGYFNGAALSALDLADKICIPIATAEDEENHALDAFKRMLVSEKKDYLLRRMEVITSAAGSAGAG